MAFLNYALPPQEYTIKNALLWGNFYGHAQKVCHGKLGKRIVHLLICVAELLPVISQIASLFERVIVLKCLEKFRERMRQGINQQTVQNQPVVKEKEEAQQPGLQEEIEQDKPTEGEPDIPPDPPVSLPNITPIELQNKENQSQTPNISPASSDLSDTLSTDSETPVSIPITAELQLEKGRQDKNKETCIIA